MNETAGENKMTEQLQQKPRICIAGIGAIGGLLAGMLGRKYAESLSLIAHGARREALLADGVVLKSEFYGDSAVRPAAVVPDGSTLGIQDYVLVTVKNYSMAEIIEAVRPCVGRNTVIAAVMNGVEPGDRLREAFPEADVVDALIYTLTASRPDYSAEQTGQYTHIFLGKKPSPAGGLSGDGHGDAGAKRLHSLLLSVGFDARFTEDIEAEIWKKFILNCGFNTVTARYLTTSGEIRRDARKQEDLRALIFEAEAAGRASGVHIPDGTAEKQNRYVMEGQPDSATSSLRRDVEAHRRTELDAFLGAVMRRGRQYGIPVPVTERYFRELSEMISSH